MSQQTVAVVTKRSRGQEPEWLVVLTVALAVILGLALQYAVSVRSLSASVGSTTLSYPAGWVRTSEEGAQFAAADLNRGGAYAPRVSVREFAKTDLVPLSGDLYEAALNWSVQKGENLVGYRVLDIQPVTLAGRPAYNIETAYLMDDALGSGTNNVPGLMHAVDTVVESRDKYYVLNFATEQTQFARQRDLHNTLLAGWRIQ